MNKSIFRDFSFPNIFHLPSSSPYKADFTKDDTKALEEDWKAVGEALQHGFSQFEKNILKKQEKSKSRFY